MADARMQKEVDVIISDPEAAVKKAGTAEGREFYALSALTLTVQTPELWPKLRNTGVLNVYIQLLVDEWTSKEVEQTAPGWVFSLTGIINVLVSLKKDERGTTSIPKANNEQYEIIRKAYPRIEATLWKVHTAADSDKLIDVLALGMFHIGRVPDLHPILYTPHTLAILGHCYTTARSISARKVSCLALRTLLTAPTAPPYALDNFYQLTPFPSVSRALIHNVFLNPALGLAKGGSKGEIEAANTQLAVELLTADAFVNIGQKEAARFVDEAKLHEHVVELVGSRVRALGGVASKITTTPGAEEDERERDLKWALLDSCAPFLNNIINASSDVSQAFADLIKEHDFLELASEALLAAAPRTDSYQSAWFRIFKMLIHTTHCTDSNCRIQRTPAFTAALQSGSASSWNFPQFYLSTLDKLDIFIAREATRGFTDSTGSQKPTEGDEKDPKIATVEDGIRRLEMVDKEDKNARAALWQVTLSLRALGAAVGANEEILRGDKPGERETGMGARIGVVKDEVGDTKVEGEINGAAAQKEKERRENVCWWPKCDAHTKAKDESEEAAPYKRCSACRCVTYCSAEHQKLDWKDGGHKDVCAIIKHA
ncbi:hypothetical protein DL93DRAFT_2083831 [Clavulina sp. PMI_390]|nr:hypothetical protein DL93DRAFT_2083831 [Clavulina sp. PMI_390]